VAATESLSPSDLSAIQAEQGPVTMHMGAVLVFEGAIEHEEVLRRFHERIHLVPRYRLRLDEAHLGLARPVWIEDEDFDPARHIKRLALPAPGGDAELCELVGRVMSSALPRDRPLWEIEVVEGLAGGGTALIAKLHHALVDGVGAVDIGAALLDPTPEPLELPPPEDAPAEPERAHNRVEQLSRIAAARIDVPRKLAVSALTRTLEFDPVTAARQARESATALRALAKIREPAPDTRLNAEIGRDRVFALGRGRLEEVKAVRRAAGATVNDVVLAAVALALSDFLAPNAPERAVALVPVSVRDDSDEPGAGNQISTVFCDLPLRGEPLDRVRAVHAEMERIKASAEVQAGALMVGATGFIPPIVSSVAVRALAGPRLFNLVATNVPGPQQTFYMAGVAMTEIYPAAPLNPRNQALSIGALSYDGGVYFGLLADRDTLPDVADAASGLERALATLVEAAGAAQV